MPTEVKICGLSSPDAVDAALDAGADLVGFVFFDASPRNISVAAAADLARPARGEAYVAALTVDASDDILSEIVDTLQPDVLQLHGSESPERVAAIREIFGIPVMKAIGIATAADLAAAAAYAAAADRLLIDAKPPETATRPGGNGRAFDWAVLDGFDPGLPWLLSGGLDAGNVLAALTSTAAPGVDVSSGVERAPGDKDPALIRAFIRAVRDGEGSASLRRAG